GRRLGDVGPVGAVGDVVARPRPADERPAGQVVSRVPPDEPTGQALLALAAARAGAVAVAELDVPGRLTVEEKTSRNDLVTSADRAAERAVVAAIRAERPDDAILGEEYGELPGGTGLRWVVDPVDGTMNL